MADEVSLRDAARPTLVWEIVAGNDPRFDTCGDPSPGGAMRCESGPAHPDVHMARDRAGRWRHWPRPARPSNTEETTNGCT